VESEANHGNVAVRASVLTGRLEEERWRDGDPECLSGLEVDNQLKDHGLLHRQVGWFGALQEPVHITDGTVTK